MWPTELLDDHSVECESKVDQTDGVGHSEVQACEDGIHHMQSCSLPHIRPGAPMKADPFGRDVPRHGALKAVWSVEPLIKYLKNVLQRIDANMQDTRLPTAEKLDAFVSRLVGQTSRIVERAPKKVRVHLRALISRHFNRFWNFVRNEKVRVPTPEELHKSLLQLIDGLMEFHACPDALSQPSPLRQSQVQQTRILDVVCY